MSARDSLGSGRGNSEISQNIHNRAYIECLAELFILCSLQKTSNDILAKLKAARIARVLANSHHQYGHAVQDILSEKTSFHERLLLVFHAQERTRIDYLKGVTDVEPVHDVLFTGLKENPIPASEADWDLARGRFADIQVKVDALKPKAVAEERGASEMDVDPQGPSTKRRRLDSPSDASGPSASSSTSKSKQPVLTIAGLEEMIQDESADILDIDDTKIHEVSENIYDLFDQYAEKLRNPPVPLFNEENVGETFSYRMEQLRLQSREDVTLVEKEIVRKRERNAELGQLNRDLENRTAKYDQWVREATALVEDLRTTPSSESKPSLLSHPDIAQFVAPLRLNLMISARTLMYGLLEGARKDLQKVIGGRADDLLKDFERELKPTFQQTEEIFHALF